MLGITRSNASYQKTVLRELRLLVQTRPDQIREYEDAIAKMLILNLDPLIPIITPYYPPIGRPAEWQVEIFRSLVLMQHCQVKLDNWVEKLTHNPVLRTIAGLKDGCIPQTASYYDFINRFFPLKERPEVRGKQPKPDKSQQPNNGEKWQTKHPGIVDKLVEKLIDDEAKFMSHLSRRPEKLLQRIFADVAVFSSKELGLIPDSVNISGDGTCIETGASHYGKAICHCRNNGIYKCDCPRKFSDPNAVWGWDSSKKRWFYGYTGYFISTYNIDLKLDLPLYLRLVEASRHDSVSAVFALAEFRELYPNLHINTFISDSASDNYATYKLLNHWNANAVIALNTKNKGNPKYPPALKINENGVPICPGNRPMIYNGYCRDRCRFKWRCPRVVGKLATCEQCASCSPSPYGRVIYTKADWDLRLFTRIPRGTDLWKSMMRQRTSSERINDRILLDYGVEESLTRGKKRISFFSFLAGINVHLDAQLKILKQRGEFNFNQLLGLGELT